MLDSNLVAVAPFDVLVSSLALWREGLVDVLSRSLDGAGPLVTVSPTVVVRRWTGRADPLSARELGRRTGAGLAVFGQVVGAGSDSIRATATVLDVGTGRPVGEVSYRENANRMDRIGDSLTIGLLREMGRIRPIGAVRLASLGSSSLPAVKAFLRGEQFYRVAAWDSVIAYDERAVAVDSAFVLARRRLGMARGWQNLPSAADDKLDRVSYQGLSTRDSLLILHAALDYARGAADPDSSGWLAQRSYKVLRQAASRYPNDPEVWDELGEFRHHNGWLLGLTWGDEEDAFRRAITLDPAFLPSYFHAVELALRKGDITLARRYARAYIALDPTGMHQDAEAVGTRLTALLLDPAQSAAAARLMDTLPADPLIGAYGAFRSWPDSEETAVRLTRLALASGRGMAATFPQFIRAMHSQTLAFRGHLHESYDITGTKYSRSFHDVFVELALAGVVPAATAAVEFDRLLQHDSTIEALPWWAERGDTTSINALWRSSRETVPTGARQARRAAYINLAAPAYLALAQRDSSLALTRFEALPESLCWQCYRDRLTYVRLLAAAGRDREAADLLDGELTHPGDDAILPQVWWLLERARVNRRLGRREQAITAYRFVVAVWRNADPKLKPFVNEAIAALRELRAPL